MISLPAPVSPSNLTAPAMGSDYFSTEAHYLSLAGRIVAALHKRRSFVLVVGDPPAGLRPLTGALRRTLRSRQTVIAIACGPNLRADDLRRAGSAAAGPPAAGAAQPGAPLFVLDDVDQLSGQQAIQICEVIQHGFGNGAAVLLARPDFLARLETPSLQFLRETLAGQFRFQYVGEDEGIEFLRHRLAARRRRNGGRSNSSGFLRAAAAFAAISAAGIGGFFGVHSINMAGNTAGNMAGNIASERFARTTTGTSSPPQAAAFPSPGAPVAAAELAPAGSSAPPGTATGQPALLPETASPAAEPAPSQPAQATDAASPDRSITLERRATPRAASPRSAQSLAGERPTPDEIARLIGRGDAFLAAGDVAAARLFYERGAAAGDALAALRLGATFDPEFLGRTGILGAAGDPAEAASWYRRARELQESAVAEQLRSLSKQSAAEPDASAP